MAADKVSSPRRRTRTVLHGEELERTVRELSDFAQERALELRRRSSHLVRQSSPRKPEIDDALTHRLRAALEDEVVPAVQTSDGRILPEEFDRELIKKALASLKAEGLRKVAHRNAIEASGGLEELATRIGWLYRWDRERIAQLVLENEPEPTEERSHVDRLYPLAEIPNLEYVHGRLDYVLGRYIRTGIARWFVFETLDAEAANRLVLTGTQRAFRADITEHDEAPSVVAIAKNEHPVQVVVDRDSPLLRVRQGNTLESAAAVEALRVAARVQLLGGVPHSTHGITEGPALAFAPASLFMLDLLATRFHSAGLRDRDLTVARFRIDEDRGRSDFGEAPKPRLRAVRFEGSHLLDSPPACKLLAEEGRALVDVAMTVKAPRRPDKQEGRYPVRVAIERDHVAVLTGFGVIPELSFEVHRSAVSAVSDEILLGLAGPESLANLAKRIEERARTSTPVERADMLTVEDDAREG